MHSDAMSVTIHHFPEWNASLLVPLSMLLVSVQEIEKATNGCGREGIENLLVPDTIWGLQVTPICRVHDWMYEKANAAAEKHRDQARLTREEAFADGVFACNLVWFIREHTKGWFLRWLRLRRAYKYVDAVTMTDVLRCLPLEVAIQIGEQPSASETRIC